ncbi:MAG TPA: hypothetical protein VJN92_15585 [Candidatus Acidoferrum sp.]|nr:hypothetical protein [Candidatus Acidoferrum sp.]
MSKYTVLQGDGRAIQGELDTLSKQGYTPILYTAVFLPGQQGHPGIINHCVIVEQKEEKK